MKINGVVPKDHAVAVSSSASFATNVSPLAKQAREPAQRQQQQQQQQPLPTTTNNNNNNTAPTSSQQHSYSSSSSSSTSSLFHGLRKTTGHLVQAVEDFFFPRFLRHAPYSNDLVSPQAITANRSVRGGVLLEGCTTAAEHRAAVQHALELVHGQSSATGLAALGLEYRLEPCPAHSQVTTTTNQRMMMTMMTTDGSVWSHASPMSGDDDDDDDHHTRESERTTSQEFEMGPERLVPVCFSHDNKDHDSRSSSSSSSSSAKDASKKKKNNHDDNDDDDDGDGDGDDPALALSSSPTSTLAVPPPANTTTATATASITAPTITPSTSDQDILSTYNTVGGTVGASTCRFGPIEDGKLPIPPHRPLPRTASTETLHDLAVDIPYDYLPSLDEERAKCPMCMRRLYHIPTNTLITEDNRKRFIADGDMYEEVARLCQEYAHEIMCEEGGLEWVLIEPPSSGSSRPDDEQPSAHTTATADHSANTTPEREPIRAMVNSDHPWFY